MGNLEFMPCPICKQLFHTEDGLKRHMDKSHDVELISINSVEIQTIGGAFSVSPEEVSQKKLNLQEGDWVEIVSNGERVATGFVRGAGQASCLLEILDEKYIPYRPYKPLKKEVKNMYVRPLSFFLSQKDQELLQDVMVDLALATGDKEWFESLTSKYL